MKVQIYLYRVEDAAEATRAGADFIGVCCDARGLLDESLSYDEAREVFGAVGSDRTRVALTVVSDVSEILEMIDAVGPDVVQLAGRPLPVASVRDLRSARPLVKFIQAISMNEPNPLDRALMYQSVADYLILDTNIANETNAQGLAIGATGITHDWGISADVVSRVRVPVILAGGLSPDNVVDAIRIVRPWGVDSYSHTNRPGMGGVKDPDRMAAFVQAAKAALWGDS